MKNTKLWISAMRLRTLPLSISGIIVASCLAAYNGLFSWPVFILAILTTLSFQTLSNLANDYGDGVKGTDNNERLGPERAIQSGNISPQEMYSAIKINVLISIGLSFFLILTAFGVNQFLLAISFFLIGIVCIVAAIKYTMGNSAYGYRGLGDIFVFIFFGLVSVIGCYILFARQIDHVVFLPACTIGLLSTAVLNLNNMRDINSDKNANKITIPVRLGRDRAKTYHYSLIVTAIILSALFGILYYNSPVNLIFIVAYVPLFKHLQVVRNNKNPQLLDPELKKLALTTVVLAILLGIGHLF